MIRELDSFENAVKSWKSSGLLDYADETILWINERTRKILNYN